MRLNNNLGPHRMKPVKIFPMSEKQLEALPTISRLLAMRRQIPGKEWAASDGSKNDRPGAAFPVGCILSLPIVAALAIHLFLGTTTALAAGNWKRRPDSPAGDQRPLVAAAVEGASCDANER
jgi:hypothetical protein